MHRTWTFVSSLVVGVSTVGMAACSSNSTTDAGTSPPTMVSFKTDVIPVFQAGCTLTSECHGQTGNANEEDLYLGDQDASTDTITAMVYNSIVNQTSHEDPNMDLIKAGDPTHSYILQKLANNQMMFANDCASKTPICTAPSCSASAPCGASMPLNTYMPPNSYMMADPTDYQKIQDWVTQGANNN